MLSAYTLIIGGFVGSGTIPPAKRGGSLDGNETDRVEVVGINPNNNNGCLKVLGNFPKPIRGAVGTTFGE